ncbi:MAG TPA: DMT family transporter [Paludibacteraceae bacterium]|nr:DMT family transporter [Paludibacteraceae bacterium]
MIRKTNTTKAYVAIIVAMTIWSASFIFTRIGLESFPPIMLVTMRMVLAAIILGIYGGVTKQIKKLDRKDVKYLLIAAFAEPFCYFVCEAYGLTLVSPTVASVILSTIPLFAPLFAFVILRERVTWSNMLGIIISLAGVLMLVIEKEQIVVEPIGLLVLMIAVLAAVIYSSMLKKVPEKYNATTIVFYVYLFSLLFFIPAFFLTDFQEIGQINFQWRSFYAVLTLAIFASVISFVLFCYSVRKLGVTRANAFCNIMPGCTALFMWILYDETLPVEKIIAIAIVIIGLFISQIQFRTKKGQSENTIA